MELISKVHPEMNNFFLRLERALQNLPNNPKPECKGFYLAFYDGQTGITTCEPLGFIPEEKRFKYNYFAQKKCAQTLYLNKRRSKAFAKDKLEQYAGGIRCDYVPANKENVVKGKIIDCAGVSGHESMVDEAIAALFIIARRINIIHSDGSTGSTFMETSIFANHLLTMANVQRNGIAPDNHWITIIAELIVEQTKVSA